MSNRYVMMANRIVAESIDNWLRDIIQQYTKQGNGVAESYLLRSGKSMYGVKTIKQALKELAADKYIAKKNGKWIWIENM